MMSSIFSGGGLLLGALVLWGASVSGTFDGSATWVGIGSTEDTDSGIWLVSGSTVELDSVLWVGLGGSLEGEEEKP